MTPLPRSTSVPAHNWTDEGGIEALSVAATCTDPDGIFGPPRVYTAWAARTADLPFVDHEEVLDDQRRLVKHIYRKFVGRDA